MRQQLPVTPENQRQVLGNALSLVRFPLMSKEEFTAGPAQSGLLNYSEASIVTRVSRIRVSQTRARIFLLPRRFARLNAQLEVRFCRSSLYFRTSS